MIPLEESVATFLCAGASRRFGIADKLLAPLEGKPLVAHAASLCAGLPFAARIAVVPPGKSELRHLLHGFGFETVENPEPDLGKDSSIRLGLARGLDLGGRGIMVLLGDMPHVSGDQLRSLCAAATDEKAAISESEGVLSPPTLIPAALARVAISRGDRPVRACLGEPARVSALTSTLTDYDRPDDFRAG